MKGIKKAVIGLVAGIVAIFGVAALAACSDNSNNEGSKPQTVTGQWDYEQTYSENTTHYGVKVNVTVEDGKITKVEIAESDFVQATPSWTETDDGKNYLAKEADLLNAYKGLDVEDVLDMEVATASDKAPLKQNEEGFKAYTDEDLLIDGATQSCGRILLAVQNALEKL